MTETLVAAHLTVDNDTNSEPADEVASEVARLPTVVVSINSLLLDDSPRCGGENYEHIHVLIESEERLPPILIHGQSMRVIDGRHRVRAAIERGAETIDALIYHGTDADAFVLAVHMNVTHGLPLTRADRIAAALRIIESHPHWSNRMIATTAGLSQGTVAKARQRSSAHNAQSTTRIGKDGRERPLDAVAGRRKASVLLTERPTASNREIAAAAGISASTVRDVRQRLRAGQNPAPPRQRIPAAYPHPLDSNPLLGRSSDPGPVGNSEMDVILAGLKADPSLRLTDAGRALLRCLDRCRVNLAEFEQITEIPDHLTGSAATLARSYARVWTEIETLLEKRWAQLPS